MLQAYVWPGNVFQLAKLIEQAHVLSSGEIIELSDIPIRLQAMAPKPAPVVESLSLEDIERDAIAFTLNDAI